MNLTTRNASARFAGDFTRIAKSIGEAGSVDEAWRLAERTGASDGVIETLRTRAATSAATLTADDWGGHLSDEGGVAANFIASLRPQSVFYRFVERSNVFPLRERTVIMTALQVNPVGEGTWIPVVAGSFDAVTLAPRKVAAIVAVTEDMLKQTDPTSFAILRRELQRAAIAAVDTAFLTIALDGITAAPAPDLMAGISTMLDEVAITGAEELLFVPGVKMANKLSTATDTAGARLFPTMGPSGGKLLGLDVMVSDRIDADTLALIDAAGFHANEGEVAVDLSRHGDLKMETDPATGAAEMVSLYQTNSVGLRVIAGFGADRIRDTAVAAIKLGT